MVVVNVISTEPPSDTAKLLRARLYVGGSTIGVFDGIGVGDAAIGVLDGTGVVNGPVGVGLGIGEDIIV